MIVGLTYDLRSAYLAMGCGEEETAEFDREETITAIEEALRSHGHGVDRIGHVRQLVSRLAAGHRWGLVFNIAEGLRGIGREAQVPALLDAYDIPYTFSDPLVMSLTLHKGATKRVVRDAGIPTADFHVVAEAVQAAAVSFGPPYFIKPVAEGTGKGITPASIIHRRADLAAGCRRLLENHRQPVLVERFLSGREFTTAILGTGERAAVIGTIEVHLLATAEAKVYSYANKEHWEGRVAYDLVKPRRDRAVAAAEKIALMAWQVLGCRDAGRVDIRCDGGGRPQFMEVNPLAGLHPGHSDLPIICGRVGMPYRDLIGAIVASARLRMPHDVEMPAFPRVGASACRGQRPDSRPVPAGGVA